MTQESQDQKPENAAGADAASTEKFGRTPLHRACAAGHTAAVEALLRRSRVSLHVL
jgi:ankyrin repeat protein